MTMLDRMRRHINWLKWSLGLVVLAFVIFYIPDLMRNTALDATASDTVAVVEGQTIRADEFRRNYQAQLQSFRSAYGGKMNDQLLKQLGLEQQILQQMVDERAALVEAERLGLSVSDEEVAQRIFAIPAFQENGTFIGQQRYQQLLASQRPPLTTTEFEDGIRRALAMDKLRVSVTDWLSVSDKELEREYKRQNDKVKLAVITLNGDAYRAGIAPTDAEVSSYFSAHTADFKVPEKRRVKYLLLDLEAMRAKITVPVADVERAYNDSIDQYTTPEQVRASHILFKIAGKDDAAVKATAEGVLKQARAGGDFAALARKYSEDDSNAKNGGDLDFFGKGRMVPEFDAVAFTMETGQISDLVKTQFGYHIIKLTDKKPGVTRKLDEVRQEITDRLAAERAQAQAEALAERLQTEITKPADLDTAAKAQGLAVQETGLFARDEPILAVGSSPEMTSRAFTLNAGEVAGPLQTGRGFVFETLVEKKDPYVPALDEAKDRVREEVIRQRTLEMAKQKAAELAAKLKAAPDFDKAAKAANVEVKATDFLSRDGVRPDLGATAEVVDAAFKLTTGSISDPVATPTGAAIFKLVDKVETTATDVNLNKESFRDELLSNRKNMFFSAYMAKAKQKMKIQVNRESLQRAVS